MKEISRALKRLCDDGVISEYAIGGGIGALAYVEPFLTEDIDVFAPMVTTSGLVDPTPILNKLRELGYSEMVGDRVVIGSWPVQFLPPASELEREAVAEAREEFIDGAPLRLFSAEHLMAISLKLGRPKDLARLEQFIESGRFQDARLNSILERHGLASRWDEFVRKVKLR